MKKDYIITVIDGQGGSLGRTIVKRIKSEFPLIKVLAIGTNSLATSSMLSSSPDNIATGENPVIVAARDCQIIVGAMGIIVADSLHGEITPKMAVAVGQSKAHKILIPISKCNISIAGTKTLGMETLLKDSIELLRKILIEDDVI